MGQLRYIYIFLSYSNSCPFIMMLVLLYRRFPCTGSDVKRRIETLIEREYLERDKDDNTVYNYLA